MKAEGLDFLLSCLCHISYAWCSSCFLTQVLDEEAWQEAKKRRGKIMVFALFLFCLNGAMALFLENRSIPYILRAALHHLLLFLLVIAGFQEEHILQDMEKKFLAAISLALITMLIGNFSESLLSCGWLFLLSLTRSAKQSIGPWGLRMIMLLTYGIYRISICRLSKPFMSVCSGKRKTWYLYLAIPLSCILGVTDLVNWAASNGIVVQNWGNYGLYENQLFSHGAMCLFTGLAMAASGFFVFGMNKINQEERAGEQYRSQVMYYQMLEEQYTQQERLRHDLKNHLLSLENLIQNRKWEQAGNYLREMTKIGQIEAGEEATGSLVMDALLYHKKREALEHGIHWKSEINYPKDSPIQETHLCILVGNMLDNALEACIRLQEKGLEGADSKEELRIQMDMRTVKQCLLFEVRNSTDLTSLSETVKSRKKHPEHHGLGLAHIKAVAEAYHGTVHMEIEEGNFIMAVLLPFYR